MRMPVWLTLAARQAFAFMVKQDIASSYKSLINLSHPSSVFRHPSNIHQLILNGINHQSDAVADFEFFEEAVAVAVDGFGAEA